MGAKKRECNRASASIYTTSLSVIVCPLWKDAGILELFGE
jgi:hypothetical protein